MQTTNPNTSDWPCIYRKVPELSAAAIWDGPTITDTEQLAQRRHKCRKLSEYLVSRRVKEADAEAAIKKFADSLPADTRDAKLTELFAAVLTRTNEDRKVVMSGIERFQRASARTRQGHRKGRLVAAARYRGGRRGRRSTGGRNRQTFGCQKKYKWEVRVFQEKQANIPLACEIPELIDQRAGDIARAIRAQMKS